MNMINNSYGEQEFEYHAPTARRGNKTQIESTRPRRQSYARGNRAPVSHNGIHRRRNKRFSW